MTPPAHKRTSPNGRPWVLYNAAMSIDGKIATTGGDTNFSDPTDWKEVHQIRSQVDGIMVGSGTVLADDPRLTIQTETPPSSFPLRIVVDSRLQIPEDARVINFESDRYLPVSRPPARGLHGMVA